MGRQRYNCYHFPAKYTKGAVILTLGQNKLSYAFPFYRETLCLIKAYGPWSLTQNAFQQHDAVELDLDALALAKRR